MPTKAQLQQINQNLENEIVALRTSNRGYDVAVTAYMADIAQLNNALYDREERIQELVSECQSYQKRWSDFLKSVTVVPLPDAPVEKLMDGITVPKMCAGPSKDGLICIDCNCEAGRNICEKAWGKEATDRYFIEQSPTPEEMPAEESAFPFNGCCGGNGVCVGCPNGVVEDSMSGSLVLPEVEEMVTFTGRVVHAWWDSDYSPHKPRVILNDGNGAAVAVTLDGVQPVGGPQELIGNSYTVEAEKRKILHDEVEEAEEVEDVDPRYVTWDGLISAFEIFTDSTGRYASDRIHLQELLTIFREKQK